MAWERARAGRTAARPSVATPDEPGTIMRSRFFRLLAPAVVLGAPGAPDSRAGVLPVRSAAERLPRCCGRRWLDRLLHEHVGPGLAESRRHRRRLPGRLSDACHRHRRRPGTLCAARRRAARPGRDDAAEPLRPQAQLHDQRERQRVVPRLAHVVGVRCRRRHRRTRVGPTAISAPLTPSCACAGTRGPTPSRSAAGSARPSCLGAPNSGDYERVVLQFTRTPTWPLRRPLRRSPHRH